MEPGTALKWTFRDAKSIRILSAGTLPQKTSSSKALPLYATTGGNGAMTFGMEGTLLLES
jgi:hypothetical protein